MIWWYFVLLGLQVLANNEYEYESPILNDVNVSFSVSAVPTTRYRYVPMLPLGSSGKPYFLSVETDGYMPNLNPTLRSIAKTMKAFVQRMSRNRIQVTTRTGSSPVNKPAGFSYKVRLLFIPGRWSRVPIIGNAITARHELFHEAPFSLGHANTRLWNTQTQTASSQSQRDPFDPMTRRPGVPSFNAAHLHYLRWFSPTEEAYVDLGVPYVLRVINDGSSDFQSLKAVTYVGQRQVWFSYVRVRSSGWSAPRGMPGTALAIHEGLKGSTFLEGLFGIGTAKTEIRSGLIVNITEATPTYVKVTFTQDTTWVYQN